MAHDRGPRPRLLISSRDQIPCRKGHGIYRTVHPVAAHTISCVDRQKLGDAPRGRVCRSGCSKYEKTRLQMNSDQKADKSATNSLKEHTEREKRRARRRKSGIVC